MNSYERIFAAVRGEDVDCIPVAPYDGNFSIHAAGYRLGECYLDGKKLADAQYRAWEMTGQDVVTAQSDQYYLAEALGVKTEYYEDRLPGVIGVPIEKLGDIARLKPANPYTDGRAYVYIEAIGRLTEKFGKKVPVRAPGCGSFTLAGHLMGIDRFITELAMITAEGNKEEEKYIDELMEITTETLFLYTKACIGAGADIVQDADSLASLDMISPAIYERFVYPYEQKFFSRVNALKKEYQFATLLHICGNNTKIAGMLADTGCDILEVDYKVDLAEYHRTVGDKVCLLGNMNPAGNLMSGTGEDVREEAKRAVEKVDGRKKFILGSGCEVAVDAPFHNVKALVEFGHSRRQGTDVRKGT